MSRYAQYVDDDGIVGESGEALDLPTRRAVFERQLNLTVRRLAAAGKRVILVYPVPGFSVPPTLSRLVVMGRDPASFNLHARTSMCARRLCFPFSTGLIPRRSSFASGRTSDFAIAYAA